MVLDADQRERERKRFGGKFCILRFLTVGGEFRR